MTENVQRQPEETQKKPRWFERLGNWGPRWFREMWIVPAKAVSSPPPSLTHGRCPVCGKTGGRVKGAIDKFKAELKVHESSFLDGAVMGIALTDPRHPPTIPPIIVAQTVKIPVIQVFFEVCECGIMYCTKVVAEEQSVPVQMLQVGRPPRGKGFPFPGGPA